MIILPPDGQTLLLGFLGMLIAATLMANLLLVLLLIDKAYRRYWQRRLTQQKRLERYMRRRD